MKDEEMIVLGLVVAGIGLLLVQTKDPPKYEAPIQYDSDPEMFEVSRTVGGWMLCTARMATTLTESHKTRPIPVLPSRLKYLRNFKGIRDNSIKPQVLSPS